MSPRGAYDSDSPGDIAGDSASKGKAEDIPTWVADVAEHVSGCIEYLWNCHTEWCYVLPKDNQWGVHMIELAPAPLELTESENEVGAFRLGVQQFDVFAAQQIFDEVDETTFRQPLGLVEVAMQGRIGDDVVRVTFFLASPSQRSQH
jgi:hypothetical protein